MGKYKPNKAGTRALLRSGGVQSCLLDHAQRVAARANSGAAVSGAMYGARATGGTARAHAVAYTANFKAMQDQAENDTLGRSI